MPNDKLNAALVYITDENQIGIRQEKIGKGDVQEILLDPEQIPQLAKQLKEARAEAIKHRKNRD